MTRILFACLGAAALVGAAQPALASGDDDDFGWGSRYNNHLSPYDGRPLGPPLTAFGPVYSEGDPRAAYATRYEYYNGRLVQIQPGGRRLPVQGAPARR